MVTREEALHALRVAIHRAGVSVSASDGVIATNLFVPVKIAWVSRQDEQLRSEDEQLGAACAAAATIAQRHREMLCLLGAVAGCVGFGFASNSAFWGEALAASERKLDGLSRLLHDRMFPEVLLFCDFDDAFADLDTATALAVLEAYLTVLVGEPSVAFRANVARLTGRSLAHAVVECAPMFYLGMKLNELYTGVMQTVRRVVEATVASSGPRIVLSSLRFPLLRLPQISSLHELDRILPLDLQLNAQETPRLDSEPLSTRHELLTLFCGLSEGANARFGRLEFISFSSSGSFGSYAGQLFSLLPYAQSIRGVHFESNNAVDFLWLAYAAFHPRSQDTKWRVLDVRTSSVPGAMMKALAFSPTGWDLLRTHVQDESPVEAQPEHSASGRIYRTAYTARPTIMRCAESGSGSEEVTVARGVRVEICDLLCTLTNLPTEVSVIVPGYGMLLARKAHLTAFNEKVLDSPTDSCVRTLTCQADSTSLCALLEIFGPWRDGMGLGFDNLRIEEMRTRTHALGSVQRDAPQRLLQNPHSNLKELKLTVAKSDFDTIIELLLKAKLKLYRLSLEFASLDDTALVEATDTLETLINGDAGRLSVEVLEVGFSNSQGYLCHSVEKIRSNRRRRRLALASALLAMRIPLDETLFNVVFGFAWCHPRELIVQHPTKSLLPSSQTQTARCVHRV